MDFLYTLHSHNRWLILAAAVLALIKLTLTWISRGEYSKTDNILMGLFSWLFTIQFVIGLVVLFSRGFVMYRIAHGVTMFLALGAVHFSARWKSSPGPIRARNTVVMIIVALVLVGVGITRLPQGWTPTVMP